MRTLNPMNSSVKKLFLLCSTALLFCTSAHALSLCSNKKTKAVTLKAKCSKAEKKVDLTSLGAVGPQGPAGESRIYGDGSAGSVTLTSDSTLTDTNLQYTSITINSGVTLTIPSGAIVRCTGAIINNGTILVQPAASGSQQYGNGSTPIYAYAPADAGTAIRAASPGEYGSAVVARVSGIGGLGTGSNRARSIYKPMIKAGGGGGSSFSIVGASGGGAVAILSKGSITNNGTITAIGSSGTTRAGGGGGGIVVLASATTVSNPGIITVAGGNGGASDNFSAAGGGGGGGLIRLVTPSIGSTGTVVVDGGLAGTTGANGSVTSDPRQGGGGGGASVGDGGTGGNVGTDNTPGAATNGTAGLYLETIADPSAFF